MSRAGIYYGPRAVPCECGSTEAYWHGDTSRIYCCDACWSRRPENPLADVKPLRETIPQVGKEFVVTSSRKGTFTGVITSLDDTWATVRITAGYAGAMCSYNERDIGEEVTIRLSFCKFAQVTP